jgi:hypothetical protein
MNYILLMIGAEVAIAKWIVVSVITYVLITLVKQPIKRQMQLSSFKQVSILKALVS